MQRWEGKKKKKHNTLHMTPLDMCDMGAKHDKVYWSGDG
jgi:hypothetical protein